MAGSFVRASSQFVSRASVSLPAGLYPFTIAAWVNPASIPAATMTAVGFHTSSSNVNFAYLGVTSTTGTPRLTCQGTGNQATTTATGLTTGNWSFMLGRFINTTNRRLSVLHYNGVLEHAQGTTSVVLASQDTTAVGAFVGSANSNFFDGRIGEFWYTNTDIQADAAQLQDSTLQQLAYGGPFSVPHIAKDIVEYRSLRKHPSSDGDDGFEIYSSVGRQTWTNTAGVSIGDHPPLPYSYVRPGQIQRNLVI